MLQSLSWHPSELMCFNEIYNWGKTSSSHFFQNLENIPQKRKVSLMYLSPQRVLNICIFIFLQKMFNLESKSKWTTATLCMSWRDWFNHGHWCAVSSWSYLSLFLSRSCMKAQGKQHSEGAACFGHMTTGMSGPKFLTQADWKKTSNFSPFKSFLWKMAESLNSLHNNNATQV